jgi:hypothetical protein
MTILPCRIAVAARMKPGDAGAAELTREDELSEMIG